MSQQVTFICDVCGKTKGDVNHWFQAWHDGGFQIQKWNDLDKGSKVQHLCGMECAVKAMTKAMQQ